MADEQDSIAVGVCPNCDSHLEFLEDNKVHCPNCGYWGVAE